MKNGREELGIFGYYRKLSGNSLVVQWLGLGAFTAGAQVQSLAGELRSRMPHSVVKFTKKKRKKLLLTLPMKIHLD